MNERVGVAVKHVGIMRAQIFGEIQRRKALVEITLIEFDDTELAVCSGQVLIAFDRPLGVMLRQRKKFAIAAGRQDPLDCIGARHPAQRRSKIRLVLERGPEIAACPADFGKTHAGEVSQAGEVSVIGLRMGQIVDTRGTAGLDLLRHRPGDMKGDFLALLKETDRRYREPLRPDDRVGRQKYELREKSLVRHAAVERIGDAMLFQERSFVRGIPYPLRRVRSNDRHRSLRT